MELRVDLRWLLDRQESILGKELAVHDYSALNAAVARHWVNTPHLTVDTPDAAWRAAALLDTLVHLRPLPARNELYAYGIAVAYLEASGEPVTASLEQWLALMDDVRALRMDVYAVAERLRSWQQT